MQRFKYPLAIALLATVLMVAPLLGGEDQALAAGKIAYGWKDKIRGVNSDGSGHRIVVGGPETEYPQWSPDGKRLLFTDPRLAIMRSGRRRRIIDRRSSADPQWSPDGGLVSFLQPGRPSNPPAPEGGCLEQYNTRFVIRPDGTGKRDVPVFESAVWWPPGRRLAFICYPPRCPTPFNPGPCPPRGPVTWRYDLAAGKYSRLFAGDFGEPSPNGREFAIDHNQQLRIVRADGSGARVIARPRGFAGQLAWSPSGRELAFVTTTGPRDNPRTTIWRIRRSGRGLRRIARAPGAGFAFGLTWGPGRLLERGWR
jgi:Tol biopolymer transport system component